MSYLKAVAVTVVLLLEGCHGTEQLAVPRGPIIPLNATHWQPSQVDLQPPAEKAF